MSNDQLKTTLKDLHHHLESSGASVDDELKALLKVLDQDIHQLLQEEAPAASASRPAAHPDEEENSLAARAQVLSARFAAQHPQLERVLRELGQRLESMGI